MIYQLVVFYPIVTFKYNYHIVNKEYNELSGQPN